MSLENWIFQNVEVFLELLPHSLPGAPSVRGSGGHSVFLACSWHVKVEHGQ